MDPVSQIGNTIVGRLAGNKVVVAKEQTPEEAVAPTAEEKKLQQLAARDAEVRAHEASHARAAGADAVSGIDFDYTTGPDGQMYATGGRIHLNIQPVPGNPAATMARASRLVNAATGVENPSVADLSAAADARQMRLEAARELSGQTVDSQNYSAEVSDAGNDRQAHFNITA